jgi:hypothetical protein
MEPIYGGVGGGGGGGCFSWRLRKKVFNKEDN